MANFIGDISPAPSGENKIERVRRNMPRTSAARDR